jgi:hypothetical protein
MPVGSNCVVNNGDGGAHEDNSRALVRHERDGAARDRSEDSGNKHAGHDGEKMRRRRERDEISGKEKKFIFCFRHRFVSTGLKINKLIATWVQHRPITFPTNFKETGTTRHRSTGLRSTEGVVLEERVDHDIALSSGKSRG